MFELEIQDNAGRVVNMRDEPLDPIKGVDGEGEHEVDQHLGQPAERSLAVGEIETARARAVAASEKRTGVPGRQTAAVGGLKTTPRQHTRNIAL